VNGRLLNIEHGTLLQALVDSHAADGQKNEHDADKGQQATAGGPP
jgi:hypothetical protein